MSGSNQITKIIEEMEESRITSQKKAEVLRTALVEEMLKLAISIIEIEFAGSGDSGNINSITLYDINNNKISYQQAIEEYKDLQKQAEHYAYEYLSGTGIDWYNNDGGQGEIIIDLSTVPFIFNAIVDTNETISHNELNVEEII